MPVPGATQPSPWALEFQDYQGRKITIAVGFNTATRALTNAVVHRDSGCLWRTVVFDNPNDAAKAKLLAAPADGAADVTYTAAQMTSQGLSTIDAAMALQITAA